MKKRTFKSLLLSLAIFCGFNLISTVINAVENDKSQTIENRKINIKKSSTIELTVTKDYYFKAEDTNTEKKTIYSYLCGDITVEISNPYNPPLKNFVDGKGLTISSSTLVMVKAKENYNIVSISINSLSSSMSYSLPQNIVTDPKPSSTDNDNDGVYNWTCKLIDGSKDASFYASGSKSDYIGFSVTYKYNHTHNPTWYADETHHWKECECGLSEYNTEKVPHNFIENEELFIAPDHISYGTKFYECECGKDVTEKVPPLGHTWDGTWYSNETHHWKECNCTDPASKFDESEHEWLFKETVNNPSVEEVGKAIYYCESCNKEKEDLSYLSLADEKIRIEATNLLSYTGKEQFQGVNVYYGETKLNLNEHYTLSENNQTNAGDYTLKITGTGTFRGETTFDYTIAKASLKVMVDNKVVTYGDEIPDYTVSYSGFVEGENESLLTGELSFKCNYAQFSDVGEYVISVENGFDELANYNIEYIDGTLSVNPKLITLEWGNTSLTYNGEDQKPAVSFVGLVNGDSCDTIVSGAQTNPGTYIAVVNGLTNPNYVLSSSVSTEYTIEPKSIEGAVVTLKDTLVYTGSELTQEVESVILDGVTLIKDVDYIIKNNTGTNVNTYTLTVEGKGNYKGSVSKDFEIIKQKVNLPTANTNLVYTGTEVTGVSASNLYDVVDGTAVNAGSHTATVTLKDSSNYEWKEEFDGTVEYAISKAQLTIITESKEVIYGDAVPTYTVSYNGLVNNETSSVLGGTLSFVSSYSQTSNVGEYDIAASGLTSENYEIIYVDGKVIVSQKEVGLIWGETQFTYNGSSQLPTVTLTGLVNNDTCEVTVTGEQINAGSYEATVTALSNGNYKLPVNVTTDYVINKATHNMSGISFNNVTVTYDGNEHEVVLEGTLPTGVEVTYTTNKGTNAGTYNAVATFTYDTANYNVIENKTATLTINKATYDMTGIKFSDVTVTYDGNEHEVVLEGTLPIGVEVIYTTNKGINAGTYNAVATFSYDTANYNVIENKTATLTINKATYDMSGVKLENKTVTYNGSEHVVVITGTLPSGVTVSYENNEQTNAGTYKVVAKFEGNENYNAIPDMEAALTINKAKASITVDTDDINVIYGNTITLPEGSTNFGEVVVTKVEMVNVGEYKVTYSVASTNNYDGDTREVKVIISPLAVSEPTLKGTYTYTGNEQTVELNGLESFMTIASGNKQTNAGNYEVVITLDDNHVWKEGSDGKIAWSIAKATYDMSGISFNNVTVTYDGNEHEVVIGGTLPTGVEVIYTTNKGINAGTYNAVATFTYDTANYNVIENKTATLTINKAKASITVDTDDINVIYGDTITLPDGTTNFGEVVVTKVEMVNVGEYKVTYSVASTNNYDGDTKEVKVIISPLAVSEPTLKGTYTYTGNEQTVELNGLESFMTIASGNKQTNAGNYEVVITLDTNHVWKEGSDGKIAWSIAKATYDLSDISFNNKTVVENGENQSLTITGTLPNGVTVTYSLTECVEPGVYEITASFTGDYNNYNVIDDMSATLVIKQTVLEPETNLGEGHENNVVVTSPEGIDPNKQLVVELVEIVDEEKDYSQYLKNNQKVAIAYDIKLLDENGIEVQPDGTLIIKILIPEMLKGREFDIMHIHDGKEKTMMEYTIEGDYVVIHVDELSEFVFVYERISLLWLIIVLSVVALLDITLFVVLRNRRKQNKETKLSSFSPLFLVGVFVSEIELAIIIVLSLMIIAFAAINVIYVLLLTKNKKKELDKEVDEQPKELIEDANESLNEDDQISDNEKGFKKFTEKLEEASDEVKNYYDIIKNELLSYSKVKSKISYKHEMFRVGREIIARVKFRGKTLCLYLALNPSDYENSKYKVEDMSSYSSSASLPTMYRVNLPRRAKYALDLISDLMKKLDIEKNQSELANNL